MAVYGIQFVIDLIELISDYQAEEEQSRQMVQRKRRSARREPTGGFGSLEDIAAIRELLDSPTGRKFSGQKTKRKASAYSKRYAANFKKCMSKHKTKSGRWKKGGYKRCVKEAHRMSRK